LGSTLVEKLMPTALAGVSPTWLTGTSQATLEDDQGWMVILIDQISAQHPSLADVLAELVDSFEHDTILRCSEKLARTSEENMGYAAVLVELIKAFDTTPEDELWHISQQIVQGTRKMDAIIESLLLLGGVRKQEVVFEPLDWSPILVEVQYRLSAMIQDSQAEVIILENWPTARGCSPWVEEVWVNYISNAIKHGGQPPRVEVGVTSIAVRSTNREQVSVPPEPTQAALTSPASGEEARGGRQVHFRVRDNGPGLSSEQQARLFAPFERLGQTQIPGHGLGLSIVLRIVEKPGGEVGVESEVGQGSTFFFTLPSR
jgi:two-component system sensor histidine kinase/response regulator